MLKVGGEKLDIMVTFMCAKIFEVQVYCMLEVVVVNMQTLKVGMSSSSHEHDPWEQDTPCVRERIH